MKKRIHFKVADILFLRTVLLPMLISKILVNLGSLSARALTNTYALWMTKDQGSIGIDGSRWAGSIYANNNRLALVHLTVRVSERLRFKSGDIVRN